MSDKHKELIYRLEKLLREGGFKRVFYVDPEHQTAIPQHVNFSGTTRLAIPLSGCHRMSVPTADGIKQLSPVRHTATFMPKGSWNLPDWINPVDVVTFGFEPDNFHFNFVECPGQKLNEKQITRGRVKWPGADGPLMLELMGKLFSQDCRDVRIPHLTAAFAGYCLNALKKGDFVHRGKAHATYTGICAYLEEYCSSNLTRSQVAKEFNISGNYLSSLFKSQSGISFNARLNSLRIQRACHLLTHFNQTLDEVSFSCGYHETGYFCRVFKKAIGCTPGEYRRQKN